jgi:restriction system protein
MAIPNYETIMLPMLEHIQDGATYPFGEVVDAMAEHFAISSEEQQVTTATGNPLFRGRVGWAKTYLKQAQLLDSPQRAHVKITPRGLQVLAGQPARIDGKVLRQFTEFTNFQKRSRSTAATTSVSPELPTSQATPEETLEHAFEELNRALAQELLSQVQSCTPRFFEKLVVDLLVAMGYGGSFADAAQVVGKSGDGGIDGIIKEDKLGLDAIYVQAKKWDSSSSMSRPDIQSFVGALEGHHASKGVFITTARFSEQARDYARGVRSKVVLIDGEQLARFMIEHNVGVSTRTTYEIKKLDSDYFEA